MSDDTNATSTGASYDGETGEVREGVDARRERRELTDAERAEARRTREERAELRRAEVEALRALDPACETEDDPPVVWRVPARMGGQPSGILLDVPRVSGRGKPGSSLVLARRSYDGAGPNGGEARDYVSAFVVYRDRGGHERRSVGVAFRADELRQVVAALGAYADELDAKGAA